MFGRVHDAFRAAAAKTPDPRERLEQSDLIGRYGTDRLVDAVWRGRDQRFVLLAEMKRRCELVDGMTRMARLRRRHDPPDRVGSGQPNQHHYRGMPAVAAMHAAQRMDDPDDADQREDDGRIECDRP